MSVHGCLMRNRAPVSRSVPNWRGRSSQADGHDQPQRCLWRQFDLDRHRAPVVPDDQIGPVKHRPAIRQLSPTIALPIGFDTSSSAKRGSSSDSAHGSLPLPTPTARMGAIALKRLEVLRLQRLTGYLELLVIRKPLAHGRHLRAEDLVGVCLGVGARAVVGHHTVMKAAVLDQRCQVTEADAEVRLRVG